MARCCSQRFVVTAVLLMVIAVLDIHAAGLAGVLDLQQHAVNPFQGAHGKVTVLLFVRTDCPVSNRYAPMIQQLARKYGAKAEFWLVYPGHSQTPAAIQKQISDYGYDLPVVRDLEGELVKLSQATTTPEAAVFTPAAKLVYHGRIDNWYEDFGRARTAPTTHELEEAIRATLEGKAPRISSAPAIGCSIADLQ